MLIQEGALIRFDFALTLTVMVLAPQFGALAGEPQSRATTRNIATSSTSAAPLAYQLFCLKNQDQCKRGGEDEIAHTPELWRKLKMINSSVNNLILFTKDRSESWDADQKRGDCEDFALTKRKRLIGVGVPAGALRIAVVRTNKGERHAVLVVKTDRGDLVLDNVRRTIVESQRTGYHWISIATNDPSYWVNL